MNTTDERQTPLPEGTVIQYRKVGTFRVVGPAPNFDYEHTSWQGDTHAGWHTLEAINAPKKYRELAPEDSVFWVSKDDVVEG